jgi:hypothetical protein
MDEPATTTAPPDRPIETWSAIALRNGRGEYLRQSITWRVDGTPSPLQAETWANADEMRVWLADRMSSFRRDVACGGWVPVRLTLRVEAMPVRVEAEAVEQRPAVMQAAGYQ